MGVKIVSIDHAWRRAGWWRGAEGAQRRTMCGGGSHSSAQERKHYRQRGEQTAVVCVLTHYLQPYMLVGIQEVIVICVPGRGTR